MMNMIMMTEWWVCWWSWWLKGEYVDDVVCWSSLMTEKWVCEWCVTKARKRMLVILKNNKKMKNKKAKIKKY